MQNHDSCNQQFGIVEIKTRSYESPHTLFLISLGIGRKDIQSSSTVPNFLKRIQANELGGRASKILKEGIRWRLNVSGSLSGVGPQRCAGNEEGSSVSRPVHALFARHWRQPAAAAAHFVYFFSHSHRGWHWTQPLFHLSYRSEDWSRDAHRWSFKVLRFFPHLAIPFSFLDLPSTFRWPCEIFVSTMF